MILPGPGTSVSQGTQGRLRAYCVPNCHTTGMSNDSLRALTQTIKGISSAALSLISVLAALVRYVTVELFYINVLLGSGKG